MASILVASLIHLLDCNDSLRRAENEDEEESNDFLKEDDKEDYMFQALHNPVSFPSWWYSLISE